MINQFSALAETDRCRFIGNVSLGKDITLAQLRPFYHALVLVSCSNVPLSLCTSVLMYMYLCPYVPLSLCTSVLLSLCTSVLMGVPHRGATTCM